MCDGQAIGEDSTMVIEAHSTGAACTAVPSAGGLPPAITLLKVAAIDFSLPQCAGTSGQMRSVRLSIGSYYCLCFQR
jgi:hypothetical protein